MPFLPPDDGHHHRPCKAHKLPPEVAPHHDHPEPGPGCCCSVVVQRVSSPTDAVWSVLRCFDRPQSYKRFVRSCALLHGRGGVGTVREVRLVSGLPASSSLERLEVLDEERRVLSFSVVGGEHRLRGYRSVTTLHAAADGGGTVVVESYVVDVPEGNTIEETTAFVDTIVRCNLQSLACVVEAAVALGCGHDEVSAM